MLNLVRTFTFWLFVKFSNIHATCWTWSELSLSKLLSKYSNIHAKCWTLSELLLSGFLQSVLKKKLFWRYPVSQSVSAWYHRIFEIICIYKTCVWLGQNFHFLKQLRLSLSILNDFFPRGLTRPQQSGWAWRKIYCTGR